MGTSWAERKLNLDLGQMEELKVTLLSRVSFHPNARPKRPGRGKIGRGSSGFWMEVWKERRLGRDRRPQTALMWVEEFRPDRVVMVPCSLHQDHSWPPRGFEKVHGGGQSPYINVEKQS